jgi:Ca2+-binding RTX toxin-like protein
VTFGGTTGVLQLQDAGSLTGTISGWRIGDAIAFLNGTVTSAAISGSTLRVTMSGGQNFNYQLAGQQAGTVVQLSSGSFRSELRLVSKPPPVVTETLAYDTGISSTDKITFDPALTGSGDPNATVRFTIDGAPIAATVTADAAGNWSYTPAGLADGVHTIIASEANAAGQTGSASLTFRLDADKNVAPSLLVAGGGTPTVNAGVSRSVVFVVTGLDDETGTATFSDGKSSIAVTVLGSANYTVDLSALADGPISSTLTASDIAGNNIVTTGNQITLDTDKGVAPVLLVNGGQPVIGIAHAGAVAFTVSGLDDEIGTATFSDGSHSVTVTVGGNGAYTTNLNGLNPATITSTLNVGDAAGNRFAATGNSLTIDPGPSAGAGATTVGHGKTVDLTALANGLITPGIAGDSESITAVSAAHGTTALSNDTVTYTAPANGSDTLSFTVADQYGDTATGTVNVTVDPGPTAGTGATTVGHAKTVDLTALVNGLIIPGIAGDSESITAIGAAYGTASASNGVVTYTGPSNGSDVITYTVADQYGDTASGMVNVTVDPGPTAGAASIMVAAGASTDLTTYLLGLDKPGIAGDTLSLSGIGTSATKGMVTLSNGQLAYIAPATSGSDAFSYSVADQYGDTASASVTISAVTIGNIGNASGTVVLGNNSTSVGFGQGTVTVVAGNGNNAIAGGTANDTVVAGNGNNTVILGQGNNTVILGSGNDSVTVGDGNNTITIAGSAASTGAIKAGGGNNTLYLGAGHETVSLGGGNNTLILTTGTYDVSAGHGTDLFEFTGPQALLNLSFASNDELVFRATGFDLGVDNGLGTATPQPIAASLFSSHTDGTFATSDNRFAYDSVTGTLYYDAHGSTPGSTSFAVADLTNHPHLGASNLFFTS